MTLIYVVTWLLVQTIPGPCDCPRPEPDPSGVDLRPWCHTTHWQQDTTMCRIELTDRAAVDAVIASISTRGWVVERTPTFCLVGNGTTLLGPEPPHCIDIAVDSVAVDTTHPQHPRWGWTLTDTLCPDGHVVVPVTP